MLTGLAGAGHVLDEVGLPAQERRRLQHVDHAGDLGQRRVFVHVGEHRHADLALDLGEDAQATLQPGPRWPDAEVRLALSKLDL